MTKLENVVDNLSDGYPQLEKGTFQHVDQLQAERQTDHKLRNRQFYTADGNGYFPREDGGIDWAITRESENLVLKHLADNENSSYEQLLLTGNYRPDNAEAEVVRKAEDTVVVNMSKLRLSGDDEQYRFLQIRTKDGFVKVGDEYKRPNREEQKAIQRLGYNAKTRKMLRESEQRIAETRIYVLDPEYVAKELHGSDDNSLWRASWLVYFSGSSSFSVGFRGVYSHLALRGVPVSEASSETHEVRAEPESPLTSHYQVLLENPAEAVKAMDDEIAGGLSKLVADYLATKVRESY